MIVIFMSTNFNGIFKNFDRLPDTHRVFCFDFWSILVRFILYYIEGILGVFYCGDVPTIL
jgi:hypothetical protein